MGIDLYSGIYGFSERPFTLLPDPDFLFWAKSYQRAITVLEYGMATRAPLTVVTGEVGTGKTTLVQYLLRSIDENTVVGLISNAKGDRGDLLRWVLNALEVEHSPGEDDYVALFQSLQNFLIEEYSSGKHVALIIDEAQNLSQEVLEELRMLTNINSGKDELLQIILVGQPELRDMIRRPSMRQFAQRVSVTYHIEPMDLPTTRAYVRHRLQHVGGAGDEISSAAVACIFEESGGIPRMINKLCDLSLVYAAAGQGTKVSIATIRELIKDGVIMKPAAAAYLLTDVIGTAGEAAE